MNLSLILLLVITLVGILLLVIRNNGTATNLPIFIADKSLQDRDKIIYSRTKRNLGQVVKSCCSDFVKGIKHVSSFPLLPVKLATYHKSLLGRMLRVIGGLSAFIFLSSNTELALIDNLENRNFLFYQLLGLVGLSHLFYMITIFTTKLCYVIYHLINKDWVHKNSPLKVIMTESSGAFFCIKGICYVSGIWFTAAAMSTGLDEIIGEDFFKELAGYFLFRCK